MAMMRIVFEFEQEESAVTPQLLKHYWPESNDCGESGKQHRQLGLESEMALLAAVKAQPQVLRQLWLGQALSWMDGLENAEVFDLAKPVASGADLTPLAAELHEHARAYFLEDGMLDGTKSELLVTWLLALRIRRVTVEDAEGVLLCSDDAPPMRRKKPK